MFFYEFPQPWNVIDETREIVWKDKNQIQNATNLIWEWNICQTVSKLKRDKARQRSSKPHAMETELSSQIILCHAVQLIDKLVTH